MEKKKVPLVSYENADVEIIGEADVESAKDGKGFYKVTLNIHRTSPMGQRIHEAYVLNSLGLFTIEHIAPKS